MFNSKSYILFIVWCIGKCFGEILGSWLYCERKVRFCRKCDYGEME